MFITYWDDLGSTPARVNRFTGEIQINNRYFDRMPDFRKKFIIEHEKGHFLQNTRDEFKADRYAFKKLAGSAPRSLKESVFSISKVLTFRNPQHMDRLIKVIEMALEYDSVNNNNPLAQQALDQLKTLSQNRTNNPYSMETMTSSYHEPKYGQSEHSDLYDNAGGKAKRQAKKAERKARKDAKKDAKQEKIDLKNQKKAAKNEVIYAKADAKKSRAEAKKIKAEKSDGSGGSWWDKTLDTVGGIFGKKGSSEGDSEVSTGIQGPDGNTPDSGKLLGMPKGVAIAIIIVLVLGIIGAVIFFVKRKKAS
jgi:hypothetical protein